jgi:hypothetical protein
VSTVRWNPKGMRRSAGLQSMGDNPKMNRLAKVGMVKSALLGRRRSHSPTAPRCLRAARHGRTARNLRRTDRVSGWHRSKRTSQERV